MSNPYIVFAAVVGALAFLLLLVMGGAAMLAAFYPDDLNDHKDN